MTGEPPDSSSPQADPEQVPEEAVRAELQRVLQSPEFRTSKRCQDFIRFVVEQTLGGYPHVLKERTIGIEVFGRSEAYDTRDDGSVRMKASDVRKRLALYNARAGKTSEVRIDLPVGSYIPAFSRPSPADASEAAASEVSREVDPPEAVRRPSRAVLISVVVGTTLAIVGTLSLLRHRAQPSILEQFWAPVLRSPTPVLVAAAYVPVYIPRARERSPRPAADQDFTRLTDQFVGGGDLVATARVVGMLSRLGHPYNVKVGGSVSFEDLGSASTIMIGYSTTQWAELSKDLRFYIDDEQNAMLDDGKPTEWFPRHLTEDLHTDEDYAIIGRVFHPSTHSMIVQITGCTQYGTEGAGNMITSPTLLAEALRDAPPDWSSKNLQLVIQMKVIANSPAAPKVVAMHFW